MAAAVAGLDDEKLVAPVLFVTLIFLGFAFLFPVAKTLGIGFSLSSLSTILADDFLRHVVTFTYLQAFLSALASAVIGIPGALLYSEGRFRGRLALWRLSFVAFSLPTILVVLALLGFWGKSILGWTGILLANAFLNFPIFLKNVGNALTEIDRSGDKAALSLGAGRLRTFFSITLPKILPSVRSAFFLAFLFSSASFLPVMMLGGGPRFTTLEVAIYQALKVDYDPALAGKLAAIQLLVTFIVSVLFLRGSLVSITGRRSHADLVYWFRHKTNATIAKLSYGIVMVLLIVGPLLSLGYGGIAALPSFDWRMIASPLLTSLELAALASLVALGLALTLAHHERHSKHRLTRAALNVLGALPLTVSPIVLALALTLTYPVLMQTFRGSLLAIAIVQGVVAYPLFFRFLKDGLWRIPDDLHRSAIALGASRWRIFFRLEIPLLRNALVLALLSGVAFSLGEIGLVMMFLSEKIETLPLGIFRLMGQYRFKEAYLLSSVMIAVMMIVYWIIGLADRETQ